MVLGRFQPGSGGKPILYFNFGLKHNWALALPARDCVPCERWVESRPASRHGDQKVCGSRRVPSIRAVPIDGRPYQRATSTNPQEFTAAVTTTRSTFKIEDPPLGPGRVERISPKAGPGTYEDPEGPFPKFVEPCVWAASVGLQMSWKYRADSFACKIMLISPPMPAPPSQRKVKVAGEGGGGQP